MKLSPEEHDRYYQALGIHEDDLLSPRDVELAELPADLDLTEAERRSVGSFLPTWNRMDARMKIDAAQAAERRVLKRSRDRDANQKRLDASLAYLLLGRVRGCEERREFMAKVARGETVLPASKPRRRRVDVSDVREQLNEHLRSRGITGVTHDVTTETTADGETLTVHHLRPKRG